VDEVSVNFEMEVKSSFASDKSIDHAKNSKNEQSISQKIDEHQISAELTGSVAASEKSNSDESSSYKKSNSAK
jgi:hypothetical protein